VLSPETQEVADMVFQAFPLKCDDPADYTGLFVALASRRNAATTTGEVINAADGVGIRGHMAITGVRAKEAAAG